MEEKNIVIAARLRHELHKIPEPSGAEIRTAAMIKAFLRENTSMEITDCEGGFYAAHRERDAKSSVALRADFDALVIGHDEKSGAPICSHRCGHDGHTAGLCLAALEADGKTFGKNVFFLFQSAEETGHGAEGCLEIFSREKIDEIYGLHNLPGFPFGEIFTTLGSFAPASFGMTMKFHGKPSHAAYPADGICPAAAVGKLLVALPELSAPEKFDGMTLCTLIGADIGGRSFGEMAGEAEVRLTLRGEHESEILLLRDNILSLAEELANDYRLGFEVSYCDVFPATENDPACAKKVLDVCGGKLLDKPMRWSEDFGHYLKHCRGAFFGIGAGANHSPLHTEKYDYPDGLLPLAAKAFIKLIETKD